jgi:hypothetical protein
MMYATLVCPSTITRVEFGLCRADELSTWHRQHCSLLAISRWTQTGEMAVFQMLTVAFEQARKTDSPRQVV